MIFSKLWGLKKLPLWLKGTPHSVLEYHVYCGSRDLRPDIFAHDERLLLRTDLRDTRNPNLFKAHWAGLPRVDRSTVTKIHSHIAAIELTYPHPLWFIIHPTVNHDKIPCWGEAIYNRGNVFMDFKGGWALT